MKTVLSFNPPAANADKYEILKMAARLGAVVSVVPTHPIITIVISREESKKCKPLEEEVVDMFREFGYAFPPIIKVGVLNGQCVDAVLMRFEDGRYAEVSESEREEEMSERGIGFLVRSIWQCNT